MFATRAIGYIHFSTTSKTLSLPRKHIAMRKNAGAIPVNNAGGEVI